MGSVVANDGVFFFPAKKFRRVFRYVSVVRYQENWHSAIMKNKAKSVGTYNIKINNPVDQEVNIQFEGTSWY